MSVNPLDIYTQFDLRALESFENVHDLVLFEGTLFQKLQLLIAMAIGMEHDAQQRATALGRRSVQMTQGASYHASSSAWRICDRLELERLIL